MKRSAKGGYVTDGGTTVVRALGMRRGGDRRYWLVSDERGSHIASLNDFKEACNAANSWDKSKRELCVKEGKTWDQICHERIEKNRKERGLS